MPQRFLPQKIIVWDIKIVFVSASGRNRLPVMAVLILLTLIGNRKILLILLVGRSHLLREAQRLRLAPQLGLGALPGFLEANAVRSAHKAAHVERMARRLN